MELRGWPDRQQCAILQSISVDGSYSAPVIAVTDEFQKHFPSGPPYDGVDDGEHRAELRLYETQNIA